MDRVRYSTSRIIGVGTAVILGIILVLWLISVLYSL